MKYINYMEKVPSDAEVIDSFDGIYSWLSNFHDKWILFEGMWFPTLEHAYAAAKTPVHAERVAIANCTTPGQAKRLGQTVSIRKDWDQLKLYYMLALLRQKFADPELQVRLLLTGDAVLIEGNSWNDTYWGVRSGEGQNILGRLIMQIRDEYSVKI